MNKKIGLFGITALMAVCLTSCGENDKIAKAAVDVINVANQINSYEIQLPAVVQVNKGEEKVEVSLEYAATPEERFEFKKENNLYLVSINLPDSTKNEEQVAFKLTATAKYESSTATKEFEGFLMPAEPQEDVMTIAEAISSAEGTKVTVRGVTATARDNNKGFFIADETGAIYVFAKNKDVMNQFQYGNEVQVTATRGVNNGSYNRSSVQLVFDADSTLALKSAEIKSVPTTAAQTLTCAEFTAWKKDGTEDYAGGFYKVEGYIAEYTGTSDSGTYKKYEVIDDNGKYINFYASNGDVFATEYADFLADATVDGSTKKSNIKVNVYLAVYDAKISNGNISSWRLAPLFVERVA